MFFERMSLLYAIYRELCRRCRAGYLAADAREAVASVREYMDGHFADPTLDGRDLAERAGMSEAYFRALFKKKFKTSPLQYILSLRLSHAEGLMCYPDLSLREVASQSGFCSLAYFCRVFRARRGVSPARYRREHFGV